MKRSFILFLLRDLADEKVRLKDELEEKFEMAWVRLQVLRDTKTLFKLDSEFESKKNYFYHSVRT